MSGWQMNSEFPDRPSGGRGERGRSALHASTSLSGWMGRVPAFVMGASLIAAGTANANPEDPTVIDGDVSFVNTSDTRLDINQFTNSSLIDWRSFSIDIGEVTNFNVPSSSSVSVNRVTGGSVSEIFGTLSSNGRVLLLNTNGILFGADSRVDVSAIVASTLDIDVDAYTEGRFSFSGPSDSTASVVNRGTITVADGGLAALVAPGVENSGAIVANLGSVSLASGNAFTIDLFGDGLVSMVAGSQVLSQAIGPDGQPLDAMVANSGSIQADGGLVLLSVDAAAGLVDNVINMSGVIQARSISSQNGEIILSGGDNGIVNVSGTLDASGKKSDETGGTVKVLGEYVGDGGCRQTEGVTERTSPLHNSPALFE